VEFIIELWMEKSVCAVVRFDS